MLRAPSHPPRMGDSGEHFPFRVSSRHVHLLRLLQSTRPDLQGCDRRRSCWSAPGGPHVFLEELNTGVNLVSSLEGHTLRSDPGDQRGLLYVQADMGGSEGSPKACFLELEVYPPVGTAKFTTL